MQAHTHTHTLSCLHPNTAYNVAYPHTENTHHQALSQHVAETLSQLNVNEAPFFVNIHVQYQKRIAFILLQPPQNYKNANNFPEIDL